MIFILWFIFALIVAFIGGKRRIGFFASLLLSILLSPLIGLIIVFFSKRKEDVKNEANQKLSTDYLNYKHTRNENSNVFNVPELKEGQHYYKLTASSIPNNEIGQPITLKSYSVSNNRQVKKGKRVALVQVGSTKFELKASFDGVVSLFHKEGSFLLPDDPVFIIEKH